MEKDTIDFLRTWLIDHIAGYDQHAERRKKTAPARAPAVNPVKRAWHEVLQVRPDSSREEIRRAYQRRMSEYHPDKVAQLGEELRELAERKAKEINAAYQEACQRR